MKRILPGSTGGQAIAQPYANINDPEGVLESIFNQGIDNSTPGRFAISYNRTNEKMYIFVGSRLFELESTANNSWNVTKTGPEIIDAEGISDLAFDVFGNCYCVYNSDLATIDFNNPVGSGFGFPNKISNSGNLSNVTGLDFVLSLDNDSLVTLYASFSNGQIAEVDVETGQSTNVPSASYGAIPIGMASCQVGEDTGSYEVPFYPGPAPFVFMIEYTDRMLAVGSGTKPRIQLIREQLSSYINNFINDGQRIFICLYSSAYSTGFDINLFTTRLAATSFLDTLIEPSGTSSLCTSALSTLSNSTYYPDGPGNNKIKSCIILSAGNSQDCSSTPSLESFFETIYLNAVDIRSSDFTIKTVAVNTDIATSQLQQLGNIGNGGYVSWVG